MNIFFVASPIEDWVEVVSRTFCSKPIRSKDVSEILEHVELYCWTDYQNLSKTVITKIIIQTAKTLMEHQKEKL